VFISYAWEEEPHPTWVKELATRMRTKDGIDVTFDRWDAQPGDELTLFMEKGIRDSRFVVMICTPIYKAKFDERLGGVGYEATNITGEIFIGLAQRKIIPIHREGGWKEAAPSVVLGSFYIGLTGGPYSEVNYRALVDTLHGRREVAPPIGHGDVLFEGPGAVPATPVPSFAGRDDEMAALVAHLRAPEEKAVCVVASGIGGVGKTSLARQLVATLAPELFPDGAAWLDGRNLIAELARVSRRFGWPDANDPTPDQAKSFLANQLHDRPVLLVVDNLLDKGARANVPIPGGKCRTLVTSRATDVAQDLAAPAATLRLEHWELDVCRQYLRDNVPRLTSEPDADLDALAAFVRGLPLALRLIVRALAVNIARTAKQHLARLRAEPLGALDNNSGPNDRGVAATFLDAYRALTPVGQSTLRALASCAQGSRAEIVAAVTGQDVPTTEDALTALHNGSLADFRQASPAPWSLHDVVRIFTRSQPEASATDAAHLAWVESHVEAHAAPVAHAKLDEGIPEALTAFERLLASGDTKAAGRILYPTQLHLKRYGQYTVVVELIDRLLAVTPASDETNRPAWLGSLGVCYKTLGDISKAIDFHQRSLALNEKLGRLEGQAGQLANLGVCYQTLGDIPKAIDFHQRSLALNEKIGSLEGQATDLGNLGICYKILDDVPKAIDFLQRSLALNEKLGDLEGQANQLGNLGLCHRTLGDVPKAIDFHQRSLALEEKLGRLEGQATDLGNLGLCYQTLGDISKAIDFLQRSLALDEKLGRLEGQANDLGGLGVCYQTLGDIPKAVDFFERSLAAFRKMGLPDSHMSIRYFESQLRVARARI
jgi:tetratricopeptide (TPR) repeat protein